MMVNGLKVLSVDHKAYAEEEKYVTLCFNTPEGKKYFDIFGADLKYYAGYFKRMALFKEVPAVIRLELIEARLTIYRPALEDILSITNVIKML
ncbi:hypothetical protein [Vibrio sp. ER1A]|uniref:hypothetical protein n=1 Tax=Vibrio sp. ER1A TaxID=1517681 RepID=UPI0004DD1FA9|nr:hypothetical protein [Vibrio sp. ER1A]KFA99272.1 hypothetical protein HW45_04835 [Vibrio sp. ER1A]